MAAGIPEREKVRAKASLTRCPFQVGEISRPTHSQSWSPRALPFLCKARNGTRQTTNAFARADINGRVDQSDPRLRQRHHLIEKSHPGAQSPMDDGGEVGDFDGRVQPGLNDP